MTQESRLREMASIRQAVEHGRKGEPWVPTHAAYTQSILAGAEALRLLPLALSGDLCHGGDCGHPDCVSARALLATEATR